MKLQILQPSVSEGNPKQAARPVDAGCYNQCQGSDAHCFAVSLAPTASQTLRSTTASLNAPRDGHSEVDEVNQVFTYRSKPGLEIELHTGWWPSRRDVG